MIGTNIYFFEWSDLRRQPINFLNLESFIDFCQTHSIKITNNNRYHLKNNKVNYVVCRRNHPELVISYDKKQLRKNFNKRNNRK